MKKKELIILIPHYNNLEGLKKTLKSIKEGFKIDLMIIDDGSINKPSIGDVKELYSNGDIYYEVLEENKGIEYALNHGLEKILQLDYKYIARLDTGDICHKDRFRIQLNYLNSNPDIKLLGTQVNFVSKKGEILYISNLPNLHQELIKAFYINCAMIHPTVVFKTEILKTVGLYPTNYEAAEDYGFFFKIIKRYRSENLDKILLDVIIDQNGISIQKRRRQIKSKIKIIKHNFYLGFYPLYGIFRNFILLQIPFKVLLFIKKSLNK